MADTKISDLGAASALAGTEVLPVVQSSATKKATVTQVLAAGSATYAHLPGSTDKIVYVSKSAQASDSNDGLTWGAPKATIAAAITALGADGGVIQLSGGVHTLSATATLVSGTTLRGVGLTTSGIPTQINASSVSGGNPAISLNGASEVVLSDFYLTGRASGSDNEIQVSGSCRGISVERVTINSATTGAGIYLGAGGGATIRSSLQGVTVVNAGVGFVISASCTSIKLFNCYANACTTYGYHIYGTYCTLSACAADTNTLYGYVLQGAVAVALIGCGAESNGRGAFYFTGAVGATLVSCRGVSNNTSAVGVPSLVAVNDSTDNLTLIGCVDTTPNAASTYSVGTQSGTVLQTVTITNCTLPEGVDPAIVSRVVAGVSATQGAGLNVPHGAAPTSPVNGDMWTTTAGLYVRINGSTVGPLS